MSLLPIFSFSQNYFKDGMEWQVRFSNTDVPNITKYETYSLDGRENVDGYEALKMYVSDEYESKSHEFVMFVRTDGDKVYFKTPDLQEWLLMYDFGLQPGEGCYVYGAWGAMKNEKTYVKCDAIKEDESTGLTVMSLHGYSDETCSREYGKVSWLKGLSSESGVVYNTFFDDWDGVGYLLIEAKDNGNVVYKKVFANVSGASDLHVSVFTDGTDIILNNVDAPCEVTLFSASGELVKKEIVGSRSVRISVPRQGAYLVKIGDTTTKVNCMKR